MSQTSSSPASRDLIETFLHFAAIDGTSGRERPVADAVRAALEPLGMTVEEDDADRVTGGNCGNLIARAGDGGRLALLAHLDTARSTSGLMPVLHADRITSDGSTVLGVDDRAGVAMLVQTATELLRAGGKWNFTLGFTVCEETSLGGAQQIAFDPRIEGAVLFDSSFRPGTYIRGSYGCARITAQIHGRAAHSGLSPELGVNAIAIAGLAIAGLPLGRIDQETTANVGLIRGGTALNVVPAEAVVDCEIRSVHTERIEQLASIFRQQFEAAAASAGGSVQITQGWEFRPYLIDEQGPLLTRLRTALQAVGLEPTGRISAGGSDANVLNARGLAAINIGTGAQNPHGDDEFILLQDLADGAAIARALLTAEGR